MSSKKKLTGTLGREINKRLLEAIYGGRLLRAFAYHGFQRLVVNDAQHPGS